MFASALKSFQSNINSNYSVAQTPSSYAGPWKIYDGKKKSTGREVSIFVFDKKSLDQHGQSLGRSSASTWKKSVEEVVERLKKEASSLARLRHPNILELVEPVEETRSGGLQFATEPVASSLAGLLAEQDEQERAGGFGGRSSRYVATDADGSRRRREIEIDELEIQKGLLQLAKALQFLHENAGLVHGNLTPESIFINSKSDWKVSGLSFLSPPDGSDKPSSVTPIFLAEVLNGDPRLPQSVNINLDYSSPDFVIDNNLNTSADIFSLGLLIVALYNSPHVSPLEAHASLSTYKRIFASSSSIPAAQNGYLSSRPLPKQLAASVLPRLITRRPAQRMTAREFQESAYFDNILVSTIRFLDALPEKTPTEKAQFMRGLPKIIPQFPKSVMEKKLLPALLEEMKDRELLSLIMLNVFAIIQLLPSGKRAFTDKILPRLRDVFLSIPIKKDATSERDAAKESGLMVVMENIKVIAENCTGKEFHDDILPIICLGIESPTHALVDAALTRLPIFLPKLDFSTIKNELFPVIATVFSKTSSLGIKVRGLEAFVVLAGGSNDDSGNDGLDGLDQSKKKSSSASALDKYTIQEKMVPLVRAIKTREPAVMLAALKVLQQIGSVVDTDYLAVEVLPILWSMSLGPLLNLQQFQSFINLIKTLGTRVEMEHSRKLQEMGGGQGNGAAQTSDIMSFGAANAFPTIAGAQGDSADNDFERLVQGKVTSMPTTPGIKGGWESVPNTTSQPHTQVSSPVQPTFSWSSTPQPSSTVQESLRAQATRSAAFDLSSFAAMTPSSTQFSQALQPQPVQSIHHNAAQPKTQSAPQTANIWATPAATSNPWASAAPSPAWGETNSMSAATGSAMNTSMNHSSNSSLNGQMANLALARPPANQRSTSSFSLPPPPSSPAPGMLGSMSGSMSAFALPKPQGGMLSQQNGLALGQERSAGLSSGRGSGLDKYESLI